MRKIDKYISKEKLCNLVVNRAEKLFELSSEESNYLRNRLKKYDKMELQHLYHNFTSFGVDTIYEWLNNICIFQPVFSGKKYTIILVEGSFYYAK